MRRQFQKTSGSYRLLYVPFLALLETLPLSIHGRTIRERLASVFGSVPGWISTILLFLTLLFLVLSFSLVYGVQEGASRWVLSYLEGSKETRRLDIAAIFSLNGRPFTDESIGELNDLLTQIYENPPEIEQPKEERAIGGAETGGGGVEKMEQEDGEKSKGSFGILDSLLWLTSTEESETLVAEGFGWNDTDLMFYDLNNRLAKNLSQGRTFSVGEPAISSLRSTISGKPVEDLLGDGQGIGRILVTKRMLMRELGYSSEEIQPGMKIYLNWSSDQNSSGSREASTASLKREQALGRKLPIEVAGIFESLPGGEFLITQAFKTALWERRYDPVRRYTDAFLGPVTVGGEGGEKAVIQARELLLKDSVDRYLQGSRVQLAGRVTEHPELPGVFFSFSRDEAKDEEFWASRVNFIARKMGEGPWNLGGVVLGSPVVTRFDTSGIVTSYAMASVYTGSIHAIPAVVKGLDDAGYQIQNDAPDWAAYFLGFDRGSRVFMAVIFLLVGLLTSITIFLSALETVRKHIRDIGILKAFGASNYFVIGIYLWRTLYVWFAAVVVAMALIDGLIVPEINEYARSMVGEMDLGETFENEDLLVLGWGRVLRIGLIALIISVFATVVAAWRACSIAPGEALRYE